jgi:hypothetical protein
VGVVAGPSRRSRAAGGRPHQLEVLFSDEELAAVATAAEQAGMAARAWVGEVSVRAAEEGPEQTSGPLARVVARELIVLLGELRETRRVLTNIGGNLNDVARHVNSTGELAAETEAVQLLVARVVASVEETVGRVAARVGTPGRRSGGHSSGHSSGHSNGPAGAATASGSVARPSPRPRSGAATDGHGGHAGHKLVASGLTTEPATASSVIPQRPRAARGGEGDSGAVPS